jgi:hypothetical protein
MSDGKDSLSHHRRGPRPPGQVEGSSRAELFWRARKAGIPDTMVMTRDELLAALRDRPTGAPPGADRDARLKDAPVSRPPLDARRRTSSARHGVTKPSPPQLTQMLREQTSPHPVVGLQQDAAVSRVGPPLDPPAVPDSPAADSRRASVPEAPPVEAVQGGDDGNSRPPAGPPAERPLAADASAADGGQASTVEVSPVGTVEGPDEDDAKPSPEISGDIQWGRHGRRAGYPARGAVPRRKKRRRLRRLRIGLAVTFGILTCLVAGSAFTWVKYHEFSHDFVVSNLHVPRRVTAALVPAGGSADGSSVILVEGVSHFYNRPEGATILIRLDPGRHVASTLAIPPTALLAPAVTVGTALAHGGTARLIRGLDAAAGVRVSHVMLVNRTQLGDIVNSLHGITFHSPAAVALRVGGRAYQVPAGSVVMNGGQVAAYVRPFLLQSGPTTGAQRQQLVLRALTEKLVDLNSLSAVERLGHILASSVATDLSPSEVAGLVSTRLDLSRVAECTVPSSRNLESSGARAALAGFRGTRRQSQAGSPCLVQSISTPLQGPLASGLKLVVRHFSAVVQWLLIIAAAMWTITLFALLATSRRVRVAFGRRGPILPRLALAPATSGRATEHSHAHIVESAPGRDRRRRSARGFGIPAIRPGLPAPVASAEPVASAVPDASAVLEAAPDPAASTVPEASPEPESAEPEASHEPAYLAASEASAARAVRAAGAAQPDSDPPAASLDTKARPAIPVPAIHLDSPSLQLHDLRARLRCALHGHDSRLHRPGPNSDVVYRCIKCGRPTDPPSPPDAPADRASPGER